MSALEQKSALESNRIQYRGGMGTPITMQEQNAGLLHPQQPDSLTLIHPICRCPEDILRKIFEFVVVDVPHYVALRPSVILSSVCQRWRAVALDTPALWSKISISLQNPAPSLLYARETFIPRAKHVAAKVIISGITGRNSQTVETCGFREIPVIESLSLCFDVSVHTRQISLPISPLTTAVVCSLRLISMASLPLQLLHHGANVSELLASFPTLHKLWIWNFQMLEFPSTMSPSNLHDLTIKSSGRVKILDILQFLPKLKILSITDASLIVEIGAREKTIVSCIKRLRLQGTQGEDWMKHVSLINLDRLDNINASTDAFVAFLSAHRSIRQLSCSVEPGFVTQLARICPQIEELTVRPPLDKLYRCTEGRAEYPWPNLKLLVVFIGRNPLKATMDNLEALLRSRCLPLWHPERHPTSSPTVLSLAFEGFTSLQQLQPLNDLYGSTLSDILGDEKTVRTVLLTWPERV